LYDGVHLHNHAVDFIRQFITLRFPAGAKTQHVLDGVANFALGVYLEAHLLQFIERCPVAVKGRAAVGQEEVRVIIQTARGRDLRLQHAQRAGGGVARIGETGQAALVALGIEALESTPVHHRLAPDLERLEVALDAQRQGTDRARIFCYVLAYGAIAASYGLRELAVLIAGRHGEPVHL
jgi:hypothetical protein